VVVLIELNWFAVLAAFLVFFVTGALWFGPKTFYPVWVKALGHDPQTSNTASMGLVFGLTALGGFVQVLSLAIVLHFVAGDDLTPLMGAYIGFVLSAGFVAAGSLSHRMFSGQGLKVWAIEVSGDVVALTLAGLVFGLIA
jgi:hypothetical protein